MVVENAVILLFFEGFDILIQDWLKLFDVIGVDFEVDKSVAESCVAECELDVEVGLLEALSLEEKDLLNDFLIA